MRLIRTRLAPAGLLLAALLACSPQGPGKPATEEAAGQPGDGLFADVTAEAGIDFRHVAGLEERYWLPQGIGSGGALFDAEGDGDLDLFLVQGGEIGANTRPHPSRLFRNEGAGVFVDSTGPSGTGIGKVGDPGYGMGAVAADYDGDGDADLYVTRLGPNVLLRNEGDGRFTDVSASAGVDDPAFGTAATFLDFDRDGRLDLFVVNYVDWSAEREGACFDPGGMRDYCSPLVYEAPATARLFRGAGEGRFADVSDAAGIAAAAGNGLGVAAADFDGDGWTDLYVANDQTPAHLWINRRDGTFVEDAALAGGAFSASGMAIAGMGVVAQDVDGDGDPDLLVANIRDQPHLALRNDGGLFTDTSHAWGVAAWSVPFTAFGLALFDQDLDGELEGVVVNGAVNRSPEPFREDNPFAEPNQFVRRDGAGRFYDASAEAGPAFAELEMSRAVLAGDLDGDGDLDLVVTNNRGPAQVLRNTQGFAGAWTMLDLGPARGGELNARVRVEAAGRVFHREVQPSSGYLASQDPRLHLGLGAAERLDRVVVEWPDGSRQTWRDLPVNARLRLWPARGGGRQGERRAG